MSFEPPAGILDIGSATLRVGKLEVAETSGLNQGLQNIVKNDLLVTEKNENSPYTTKQTWGLKLPTAWVGEFEVKGQTGKYVEFNFYNEGSTSNAQGYTLNFKDTSLTLKYDNGNTLATATIPTIVGTFRKVNIFFERNVIAVSIDGIRYLYYKESDTFNQGLGVASRVVSTTGGAFVNVFFESDHGGNSQFKNLRIVNGRFISDKTSNVSFIGSLGVGVNSPQEALDIRGNMHFNRVSNVSQVSVDSNVVTEYTGPHDRPLRKYPEVALTADAQLSAGGYKGYIVNQSSFYEGSTAYAWQAFAGNQHWLSSGTAFDGGDDVFNNTNGPWISIQLPTKIKLEYLEFFIGSGRPGQTVAGGSVYASNDGSNWINIGSLDNLGNYTDTGPAHVNFTHTTRYDRYLLHVTSVSLYTYAHIERLSLYGYEEGSGSLDTTLKTVYNVPATTGTQLEVYYDAKDLTTMPSTVTDLSPNSNGGSVTGVTLDETGGINSFAFNGTSQYITASYSDLPNITDHTLAFWMKVDSTATNNDYVVTLGVNDNSSGGEMIAFNLTGGTSTGKVHFDNWGSGVMTTDSAYRVGEWVHVVGTMTGTATGNIETQFIYVNGIKRNCETTGTSTLNLTSRSEVTIGARPNNAGSGTLTYAAFFDGSIANVRFYSKALNAEQIQELYDFQKDYFLGSKSQVTLYKGHLGIGVTEPSGQLELAGDERIQEYPPRAMTGWETYMEGHGVFRAGKSGHDGYLGSWDRWHVFNKGFTTSSTDSYHGEQSYSSSTGLYTGSESLGGIKGDYFILDMPYKISLKHIKVTSSNQNRSPTEFTILGSNDGSTWTQIKSFSSSFNNSGVILSFQVNSTEYFRYFGLVVTKIVASDGYFMLAEWQLFGTPEPTTLDKGSLSLTRSLDMSRVSRYDVDLETPRPENLLVDFDTTVNSSPTDISGKGNHGVMKPGFSYSVPDKAFEGDSSTGGRRIQVQFVPTATGAGNFKMTVSMWFKLKTIPTPGTSRVLWGMVGENDGTDGTPSSYGAPHATIGSAGTISWAMWGNDIANQTAVVADRWYHCVWTYSGGTAGRRMFLDGVEQTFNTAQTASLHMRNATSRLVIGIYPHDLATSALDGYVSNFKLYNVALEGEEARKLYKLGRTGRSMVIGDTAVSIGKVPEAQLDVRGSGGFTGDLSVKGNMNSHQYWFWGDRNALSASQVIGSALQIEYSQSAGYTTAWKNSNTWECPVDGVWMAIGNFMAYPHSNQGYFWVEVRVYENDGTTFVAGGSALDMHTPYRDSVYQSWHFKQAHHCKKGQKIQVWFRSSGTNAYMELHSHWGNINIFKIG